MILYRLYLGYAKNSVFQFKDLKDMNIDFGSWI